MDKKHRGRALEALKTLSLPGGWDTAGDVAGSLSPLVRFGLEDDYWNTYADNIRRLSLDDVSKAAVN
jgi:zinc protease